MRNNQNNFQSITLMCDFAQYIEEIKKPVEKQRQSKFQSNN